MRCGPLYLEDDTLLGLYMRGAGQTSDKAQEAANKDLIADLDTLVRKELSLLYSDDIEINENNHDT
jgi:hypothetical protein